MLEKLRGGGQRSNQQARRAARLRSGRVQNQSLSTGPLAQLGETSLGRTGPRLVLRLRERTPTGQVEIIYHLVYLVKIVYPSIAL